MPKLNFGNVILCDHATQGANNKHTLVNVYSGDILFPAFPSTMMAGLYLEHIPDKNGSLNLTLEFVFNGTAIVGVEINAEGLVKGAIGVILLPSIPLSFPREGVLKLVAHAPEYRRSTLFSKAVSINPISPNE